MIGGYDYGKYVIHILDRKRQGDVIGNMIGP